MSGLSYVSLDGDIACLVNGAGLAMSTMDLIKYHGGEPANFLDIGGGANKDQVSKHSASCWATPQGQGRPRQHLRRHHEVRQRSPRPSSPPTTRSTSASRVVVRLEGTNVAEGKKLLAESGRKIITADGLTDAAQKVVAAAKGGS